MKESYVGCGLAVGLALFLLAFWSDIIITVNQNPREVEVLCQYREGDNSDHRPYKLIVKEGEKTYTASCTAHQFYTLKPASKVRVVTNQGWLFGAGTLNKVTETP